MSRLLQAAAIVLFFLCSVESYTKCSCAAPAFSFSLTKTVSSDRVGGFGGKFYSGPTCSGSDVVSGMGFEFDSYFQVVRTASIVCGSLSVANNIVSTTQTATFKVVPNSEDTGHSGTDLCCRYCVVAL